MLLCRVAHCGLIWRGPMWYGLGMAWCIGGGGGDSSGMVWTKLLFLYVLAWYGPV